MRSLCILALLSFAVVLHAQSRGKVAIVHSNYPTTLDTIVKTSVNELVEIDTTLPDNLDEYDALFIQLSYPDVMLDSSMQSKLVNYIDSGGKLYSEVSYFGLLTVDSSNPLWLRIGIKGIEDGDLNFPVDSVYGVDSEFTRNISLDFTMDLNGVEDAGPYGSIIPILFANEEQSFSQSITYISDDTSIRVVFGDGPDLYWPGYYAAFISDVVCNYFNLCAEDVKTTSPAIAPENIVIIRDLRDNGYSVSCDFTTDGEVSVFNSLGINIWSANVPVGQNLVELPATLRNGFYFVSVRTGDKVATARFSIVN